MFERSKRKIVIVIMAVLIFLLGGTLCLIYVSSYLDLYNESQHRLEHHIEIYKERDNAEAGKPPRKEPKPERAPDFDDDAVFRLSTFYIVFLDRSGAPLDVDNRGTYFSDEELVNTAQQVFRDNTKGAVGNLLYRCEDYRNGVLVAFMDNTVIRESFTSLFKYALLFGSITILCIFFLAKAAAKRIVRPLEEIYQNHKQFISDAGHELKTPVSVVSANAELLQREIGENQWLSNIQYENARMGGLVTQLLELVRTENVAPQIEPLNLSRLVVGGALPFESVAFENGLAITMDIAENVMLTGNPDQLCQLVSILIDNAIRHGRNGKEIAISLTENRNTTVFTVTNDGDPIPPEKTALLFERFYRADEARTGEDRHYGLGLSIAKAIVTAHGGTIEVICKDGKVIFKVVF